MLVDGKPSLVVLPFANLSDDKEQGYLADGITEDLTTELGAAAAQLAFVYWDADDERAKALGLSWDEIDAKVYESLAMAARHPSPSYYQLMALILIRERKSDEAIVGLQKAVALDPSDSWTFEGMAQALIHNGRPKEALAYLDAAIRINPAGLGAFANWRPFLSGFAAFGEGRYEDAVTSLRKIDLRSPEPWAKFHGLQVLLSAYGHLGRKVEAADTMANLQPVLLKAGETGYTGLRVQRFFVFKNEADIVRLLDGLAKAGLPELPPNVDPDSKERLTEAEMKTVYFGHELEGRQTEPEPAVGRAPAKQLRKLQVLSLRAFLAAADCQFSVAGRDAINLGGLKHVVPSREPSWRAK